MLEARPIVVNPDMIVLGGNMRLKAAKAAGLTEAPVYVATWEESKAKEFIVKDNVGFGEWDWDILANEWDAAELDEWGLDVWQPEEEENRRIDRPRRSTRSTGRAEDQTRGLVYLGRPSFALWGLYESGGRREANERRKGRYGFYIAAV